MTKLKPKISVIIPLYNVEKYLNRCLDSVCNQSLQEIEIICVNDYSTDSSAEILEYYSQKFQKIKILHLEKNQGVSAARNAGINIAQGEYLAFVDSDDEIDLNFYEKLYDKAQEENSDIVKGQAIEISYDGKRNIIKQLNENDDKLFFITSWWSAIYKRSLIIENNISFLINHSLGEDILFLNQALIAAKDLVLVKDIYYYYHRREDSEDAKTLSEEKIRSALNIYDIITNNINSKISIIRISTYSFLFHNFIIWCFYLSLRSEEKKSKQLCAATAKSLFEKCLYQDKLKINFAQTSPLLFEMLKKNDINVMEDFLIKCKSRMEIIASGLRARIKNKN